MPPHAWEGGEYASQFGKAASFYPPHDTLVETNPDKRRSSSRIKAFDIGSESVWLIEVRGLGVMSMRATTSPSGRFHFKGCSSFTDRMLLFGLDAEPR